MEKPASLSWVRRKEKEEGRGGRKGGIGGDPLSYRLLHTKEEIIHWFC